MARDPRPESGLPSDRHPDRTKRAVVLEAVKVLAWQGRSTPQGWGVGQSYGFRPGRGCKDALRRVEQLLEAGYVHIVDADLKSYFDTIPKPRLLARVGEKVSDGRMLALIEAFLEQAVRDGEQEWTPEEGSPQGAVISLLANIYLNPLDHLMAGAGYAMVRYADDFVILCRTYEDAERALEAVRQWVVANDLTLHPTKTRIVDARTEIFDFLGYRFKGAVRLPRPKSRDKLKDTIRAKTKRTNGDSLPFIISQVNKTLSGWFTYFRHCNRSVFQDLDCWIRGRLRSILRKRSGRRGRARGKDHQRWLNRFFEEHRLYNLKAAHISYSQSCFRQHH